MDFAELIKRQENMELAMEPTSNIVCFRYLPARGNADEINRIISEELMRDGTYYIVNTRIRGRYYMRVALMNPLTGRTDLEGLLDMIQKTARKTEVRIQNSRRAS